MLKPTILLLDEPTSALDASVQAEVLNLLNRLRAERGLTFLMVSHDLAVIDHMCDRILVMQHGRAVEEMSRDDLASARMTTAYARSLFDASADRMLGATPEAIHMIPVFDGHNDILLRLLLTPPGARRSS